MVARCDIARTRMSSFEQQTRSRLLRAVTFQILSEEPRTHLHRGLSNVTQGFRM